MTEMIHVAGAVRRVQLSDRHNPEWRQACAQCDALLSVSPVGGYPVGAFIRESAAGFAMVLSDVVATCPTAEDRRQAELRGLVICERCGTDLRFVTPEFPPLCGRCEERSEA